MNRFWSFVLLATLLAGMWWVWSGLNKPQLLALGALSIGLILLTLHRMTRLFGQTAWHVWPLYLRIGTWGYFLWLIKEIVLSSLKVTLEIWSPKPNIQPAIGWIKADTDRESETALYAHSITLTPGTTCLQVKRGALCIHALDHASLKELEQGQMAQRIYTTRLEK